MTNITVDGDIYPEHIKVTMGIAITTELQKHIDTKKRDYRKYIKELNNREDQIYVNAYIEALQVAQMVVGAHDKGRL